MSGQPKYRLTKDELAMQIHQTLREIYPGQLILTEDILKALIENDSGIIFNAAELAAVNNIDPDEFIQKIYIELGIEFEKNLHDKTYFMMTKDNDSLYFKILDDENG